MAFQDFITKCYKQKIRVPYRSENISGEALGYSWNGNMSQSGYSLRQVSIEKCGKTYLSNF